MPGTLTLVATPIGNLSDMTLRAVDALRAADIIACEDTRHSSQLLKHFEIEGKRLTSYFSRNEELRAEQLRAEFRNGSHVALVSDAGTPGISDPAYQLVQIALEEGATVTTIPGASAATAALVASGLPCTKFAFEGFLPQKKGRQTLLRELAQEEVTIVIYESPYRIVKLLGEIAEHFGSSRRVAVARELTKIYEEIVRGTAAEVKNIFAKRTSIKGEFVVVVEGKKK